MRVFKKKKKKTRESGGVLLIGVLDFVGGPKYPDGRVRRREEGDAVSLLSSFPSVFPWAERPENLNPNLMNLSRGVLFLHVVVSYVVVLYVVDLKVVALEVVVVHLVVVHVVVVHVVVL